MTALCRRTVSGRRQRVEDDWEGGGGYYVTRYRGDFTRVCKSRPVSSYVGSPAAARTKGSPAFEKREWKKRKEKGEKDRHTLDRPALTVRNYDFSQWKFKMFCHRVFVSSCYDQSDLIIMCSFVCASDCGPVLYDSYVLSY